MSEAGAAPAAAATKPPLDDVMLAMDVVDTLRRRQRLVEQELDEAGRAEDLKQRLHRIYAAQGIEVTDEVLEAGVRALKEDRFVYRPPPDSWAVRLARLYVRRGRWGKWVLAAGLTLALGVGAWQVLVVAPRAALPAELRALAAEVGGLAKDAAARERVQSLRAAAEAALASGEVARAKALRSELERLRGLLASSYSLRVVNRPGELSGVWRIPNVNQDARNYYLIVEALDPAGRPVRVPVTNEETGRTETLSKFGLRVDELTFQRVAADKRDDGIIQNDLVGRKPPGALEPEYRVQTTGAAISSW